jgi:hypothetical protein
MSIIADAILLHSTRMSKRMIDEVSKVLAAIETSETDPDPEILAFKMMNTVREGLYEGLTIQADDSTPLTKILSTEYKDLQLSMLLLMDNTLALIQKLKAKESAPTYKDPEDVEV